MHDGYLKIQLPEDWTAEQVEFLSEFLQDLNEALLATYYAPLHHLWRERHRLAHLHESDDQLELFPPTQSDQKPELDQQNTPR